MNIRSIFRFGSTGQARHWEISAAVLSAVAGLIHAWVTPEHFEEWAGYGLFFAAATVAQLSFTALLLFGKLDRRLLIAGLIGNALLVAMYLVTRTVGIPFFGPHAGEVEAVGTLDVVSKVAELGLIACLGVLLHRGSERASELSASLAT